MMMMLMTIFPEDCRGEDTHCNWQEQRLLEETVVPCLIQELMMLVQCRVDTHKHVHPPLHP